MSDIAVAYLSNSHGLSQKELAEIIGVSEPRMSAILKAAVKLFGRR